MVATVVEREDEPPYDIFTAMRSMEIYKVSTKEQLSTIENLAYEIWYEHYTPIIGRHQVEYMLKKFQSVETMAEQIKNGALYFLIRDENVPLGYMGVELHSDRLFLSKFYMTKSEIAHLEALAKEKDLNRISLTVNKYNTGSITMYEKLGFAIFGSVVKDIGEGFIMDDYQMEKRL